VRPAVRRWKNARERRNLNLCAPLPSRNGWRSTPPPDPAAPLRPLYPRDKLHHHGASVWPLHRRGGLAEGHWNKPAGKIAPGLNWNTYGICHPLVELVWPTAARSPSPAHCAPRTPNSSGDIKTR